MESILINSCEDKWEESSKLTWESMASDHQKKRKKKKKATLINARDEFAVTCLKWKAQFGKIARSAEGALTSVPSMRDTNRDDVR